MSNVTRREMKAEADQSDALKKREERQRYEHGVLRSSIAQKEEALNKTLTEEHMLQMRLTKLHAKDRTEVQLKEERLEKLRVDEAMRKEQFLLNERAHLPHLKEESISKTWSLPPAAPPARAEGEQLEVWAEKQTELQKAEACEVADALAAMEQRLGIEVDEEE